MRASKPMRIKWEAPLNHLHMFKRIDKKSQTQNLMRSRTLSICDAQPCENSVYENDAVHVVHAVHLTFTVCVTRGKLGQESPNWELRSLGRLKMVFGGGPQRIQKYFLQCPQYLPKKCSP